MGCFDIYCFICGCPCHSPLKCDNSKGSNNIESITYCNAKKIFGSKVNWLDNCSFLTANNKVLHGVKEVSCTIDFKYKNEIYIHNYSNEYDLSNFIMEFSNPNIKNYGVFIHTDCLKFIKKNYNIDLKYSDLFIKKDNMNYIKNVKYGDIKKYLSQDFRFGKLILDKNHYMCLSPLKDSKNARRISKIINQMKLKNDVNRNSPSISATLYSNGNIKIGSDNNFWKISNRKWLKMKGNILKKKININLKDKKQVKILNSLVQLGEVSKTPVFVESFNRTKNNVSLIVIYLEE